MPFNRDTSEVLLQWGKKLLFFNIDTSLAESIMSRHWLFPILILTKLLWIALLCDTLYTFSAHVYSWSPIPLAYIFGFKPLGTRSADEAPEVGD